MPICKSHLLQRAAPARKDFISSALQMVTNCAKHCCEVDKLTSSPRLELFQLTRMYTFFILEKQKTKKYTGCRLVYAIYSQEGNGVQAGQQSLQLERK